MPLQPKAFFLPAEPATGGERFCIFYPPEPAGLRGVVLYIHPFAEEMNKARRMAALQARAFAQVGYAVLQIDLRGCGDSAGDFGDATWQSWVGDVVLGCHWLRHYADTAHTGVNPVPLWLWGLRAGCLLAVQAANQIQAASNFLFWQAPSAGKPLLQQFLRLKLAGYLLNGPSKGVMDGLRQQLVSGAAVEIAGYRLASEMAAGLEQAVLAPPVTAASSLRLEWFELSTREGAALSPVSAKTILQWQSAGFAVGSHVVQGPAFWQTTEIEEAPALIAATLAAVAVMSG